MITCDACARLFPEVVGAPSQVCPHCGHEREPARAATDARAPADPLGAATVAARFVAQRYGALLLLGVPVLAIHLAAAFAGNAYIVRAGLDAAVLTTGQQMQLLGVGLPILLAMGAAWFAYWAVPAAVMLDGRVGGERLRALAAAWPLLIFLGFVLTLAYSAGLLLLLVPFFVFAHWFVHVPAAVAGGERTLAGAFEASRRFARERRTHGFTALVVLVWASVAVLVYAVDALLAPRAGPLAPAVAPLATWLTLPVAPALPAAFWALAASGSLVASEARAPTQAPARSTTTCPGCGALIPYTRSGDSVEIACPSCGRSGRVL